MDHTKKIAVLGFGAVARGAVQALLGLGATDITVFSKRSKFELVGALKNIKYKTYTFNDNKVMIEGNLAAHTLLGYDIIVNAVLQNPTKPMMFLNSSDITEKKPMIIDVSCDEGMGFDFAKPTTFEQPIIKTDKYIYYAVDHAPSHFFEAASYEISGALMPYLKYVIAHNTFEGSATLEKSNGYQKWAHHK